MAIPRILGVKHLSQVLLNPRDLRCDNTLVYPLAFCGQMLEASETTL